VIKRFTKILPYYLRFLLKLLLSALVITTILRVVLLVISTYPTQAWRALYFWQPLRIGLQFDSVIMAYLLVMPFVLLSVMHFARKQFKVLSYFLIAYFTVVFPCALFIIMGEIPYFKFFNNRLTESALQWINTPEIVFQMIINSPLNLSFLIITVSAFIGSAFYIFKFTKNALLQKIWVEPKPFANQLSRQILICFLATALCFMGLRGKIDRPIRQGDAFFGNDPILNQVGLNGVFTLIKSFTDKVNLMDNETALSNTLSLLQIQNTYPEISPIARAAAGKDSLPNYNVVLVLMESMSANYMGTFGNPNALTPNLDSLSKCSWFFKQAYSAGIHTNNGVFSSLFSFPALKRIRPMSTLPTREYSGLPHALKQKGYTNLFFTSHDETFDNLSMFIPANHFNRLYSAKDYPSDKIIGTFGVPDDYLFSFANQELNKQKEPFFATILTTSNHDPYDVPSYFKSHRNETDLKAVNYADWSIGQFLKQASKSTWFKNTLFIFVADHGLVVGQNPYDLPLSYHHIPIIIHAPSILSEPKTHEEFIGQIDLFPTLMGIMGKSYTNNTLGVDVRKTPRPYIYFSADNKIGCLNQEWLYVYRFDGGGESLYHYVNSDLKDYINDNLPIKDSLKTYALSQIQTAEYLFTKEQTRVPTYK
jgi:arylsulfatase A-like enzyme